MGDSDSEPKAFLHHAPIDDRPPVPELEDKVLDVPDGHGIYIAHHNDYSVTLLKGRQRSKRSHVFADAQSFAAWMKMHAAAETSEILVGDDSIAAALNADDPHTDRVTCELRKHPTFVALAGAFGKEFDHKGFHQLLRANADSLGDQSVVLLSELRSLRVVSGGQFTSEIDEKGYMRVHGSTANQDISVRLPPTFLVTTPIFDGVKRPEGPSELEIVYTLELVLEVDFDPTRGPVFRITCPKLDLHLRAARRDVLAYIQSLLGADYLVGVGKLELAVAPDTRDTDA